jgi:hypothetical protein
VASLLSQNGLAVYQAWPGREWVRALLDEAVQAYPQACMSYTPVCDAEEVRGGDPARCFFSSAGGRVQEELYQCTDVLDFLEAESGLRVQPNGRRGSYSYYVRPGHHLALHRDVVSCELVAITALACDASGSPGGFSFFYPGRCREPLSSIRTTPERGRLCLQLLPGQTLVMFGGVVPHGVTHMLQRQFRIVSVLCYEPAIQ